MNPDYPTLDDITPVGIPSDKKLIPLAVQINVTSTNLHIFRCLVSAAQNRTELLSHEDFGDAVAAAREAEGTTLEAQHRTALSFLLETLVFYRDELKREWERLKITLGGKHIVLIGSQYLNSEECKLAFCPEVRGAACLIINKIAEKELIEITKYDELKFSYHMN